MTDFRIIPQAVVQQDATQRLQALIIFPDGRSEELWFEVSSQVEVTTLADPFVLGVLFEAMAAGVPIQVEGTVSAGLLRNLDEFMAVWSVWLPTRYKRVAIYASSIQQGLTQSQGRISTFSGGADSCFTAFRHALNDPRLPKIDAGLMIHGLDIPLGDKSFDSALRASEVMLSSLGMKTIWMRSNIRSLSQQHWLDIFGTALAACLHVLAPKFGKAYVPSSFAFSTSIVAVLGSNPLTDRMLGGDTLEIIHDGAIFTRIEKLRMISEWPEGMSGLRVCWAGEKKDQNCCRCEKCIRNILNFKLDGLPVPPAFKLELTPESIKSLRFGPTELIIWQQLRKKAVLSSKLDSKIRAAINYITILTFWRLWRKAISRRIRRVS